MTLLLLALAGCAKTPAIPAVVDGARRVTVLHTNDLHAHYLPERADWVEGKPEIGGMVRLEQEVRAIRQARARQSVLLLDGGDQLTGTPLSDIVIDGVKGGAMHQFLGLLRYDAWALGNHEFDKGLDNLIGYAKGTTAPVLSANVRAAGGGMLLPNQEASHVFEVNGVRVGVIGATTGGLRGLMSKADFSRLELLREADAVRAEVERLDPATDLILVLSHIGVENDRRLAADVPGIDLIVGGHSHTRLTEAEKVGDTWIVQAGSYTRSLGVVDLAVADDRIRDFTYELHDLLPGTATVAPDKAVQKLADDYAAELERVYGEVVATAPATLGRDYHHESALGRWMTDALRDLSGAQVGFYNGGGLRADIVAGQVTRGDLFECFPFNNDVHVFEMTGSELLGVVLGNLAADNDESRGFLSTSGLTWTWHVSGGAPEVVEAWVDGVTLDPAATYKVAANSYITEHWEKHLGAEPRSLAGLGMTDLDAAVAYARTHGVEDDGKLRGVKVP